MINNTHTYNPLFSIIIPTYNRAGLIVKTIKSAINQDFKSFEVIVIDDGSTDNTKELIGELNYSNLQYFCIENSERGAARNFGATKAKGKFLYFLDSDDLLYPNHLEEAAKFVERKNIDVFFQQYEYVNRKSKRPNYKPSKSILNNELIMVGNFMSCHGIFIKKDFFTENKFIENRRLTGSEDYELWLRYCGLTNFYFNDVVTSALVQHEERSVLNFSEVDLISRKEFFIDTIISNKKFCKKYSSSIDLIKSNAFTYISLHLALIKSRKKSIKFLLKGIKLKPTFIFNKRFYAILKNLL